MQEIMSRFDNFAKKEIDFNFVKKIGIHKHQNMLIHPVHPVHKQLIFFITLIHKLNIIFTFRHFWEETFGA